MSPASKGLAVLAAAGLSIPLAAQQFSADATVVVVDVVVRDKGGRFVTGLTPADFTLAEDGVLQRVASLQLIGTPAADRTAPATSAVSPGASVTARASDPGAIAPEQPRFTALVFDRLESTSLAIARAGAEVAIADAGRSDVIGIFLADDGLQLVQAFTSDRSKLAAGVDLALRRAAGLISRGPSGRRYDGGGTPASIASAEMGGGYFDEDGIPAEMTSVGVDFANSWERLERFFQGHKTTDVLLTAAAALSSLPGRKTLVYFSDGIALPDPVVAKFNDVVATANRGQVTIYGIDTAGLRVGSQDADTRRDVMAMGNAGLAINADGGNSTNLPTLERNEDVLRRSPRIGLALLSKPTGGFMIDSTNDLANGVRRIAEDRRVHYLLTYAPARAEMDGGWRTIDVRVGRPNVSVQARQGYVAVRSPGGLPVLVYEGPALAALDRTPRPRDIGTRVGAFAFPRATRPSDGQPVVDDVAIVVAAPADRLTFDVKGSGYRTDFAMLALLRDAEGRVIHKTSQPYRLTGAAADRTKAMGGGVRFARTLPMSPGTYRAWGAVHDTASGRAGVAEWPVEVAGRGPTGLGISSLVVVGRLERLAGASAAVGDPLVLGDMVLTPNLGEFVHRTPDGKLGLYFTVAGADPGEQLRARVQFTTNGTPQPRPVLLEVPVTLPPAGADGTVRFLGFLPMANVPFGSLELLLRVDRGDQTETRAAYLNVSNPPPLPPSNR